eukprot:1392501-Pyramimonas_sp.AAC.1
MEPGAISNTDTIIVHHNGTSRRARAQHQTRLVDYQGREGRRELATSRPPRYCFTKQWRTSSPGRGTCTPLRSAIGRVEPSRI